MNAIDAETADMTGPAIEDNMDIRPIHTKADQQATLKEIAGLMETDPAPGTPKGDRLDILVTLVQAYEARHFPIDFPDPVEAIKFRMEQSGMSAAS